jgi:hypothetical protein
MDEKTLLSFVGPNHSEFIFPYKSRGVNRTHLKSREQLVRNLAVLFHEESTKIRGVPRGRPNSSETQNDPT